MESKAQFDFSESTTEDSEDEVIVPTSTAASTKDQGSFLHAPVELPHEDTSAPQGPRSPLRSFIAHDLDTDSDQTSISGGETRTASAEGSKISTMSGPKHKLGKIGSRKVRSGVFKDDNESAATQDQGHSASPVKQPRQKLGKIGSKTKSAKSHDDITDMGDKNPSRIPDRSRPSHDNAAGAEFSQPRAEIKVTASPTAGQTSPAKISDLQANRNRERLKRKLEAKGSNVNRKKRKF